MPHSTQHYDSWQQAAQAIATAAAAGSRRATQLALPGKKRWPSAATHEMAVSNKQVVQQTNEEIQLGLSLEQVKEM